MLVDDLHLQIQDSRIVQQSTDIQNEGLFIDGVAQHDRIGDRDRAHLFVRKVQQRTDQPFENMVVPAVSIAGLRVVLFGQQIFFQIGS